MEDAQRPLHEGAILRRDVLNVVEGEIQGEVQGEVHDVETGAVPLQTSRYKLPQKRG